MCDIYIYIYTFSQWLALRSLFLSLELQSMAFCQLHWYPCISMDLILTCAPFWAYLHPTWESSTDRGVDDGLYRVGVVGQKLSREVLS